ncbi:SOS response-associated peptidase [Roseomonas sp. 18066]|uniref:SOS response-associated peptidase n=1 Tax=Roseomonas sp. 18066 TaxID=2681412 RepID=UPI0013569A32|nr:SOS response-associated peptidase [Roseomonas sp. 18066]
MCGRYFRQKEIVDLGAYFEVHTPLLNDAEASYNIAPTQMALVVRRNPQTGARHLDNLRWGLVPRWAKDAAGAAKLMNARADGIDTKPSFREAFVRRRCLVPADGFYEWRQEAERKQPYAVALRSGQPMALAGLWEGWQQPDGSWLKTFCIVTTEANEKQALVHHRMPVILPRQDWPLWLGEAEGDPRPLLRPSPAEELACWPVATRVGKFSENDAGLIARDPAARPPPELDDPSPYEPR